MMMKNCLTFSFIIFTFIGHMYAQEAVPFKVQKEFYIYGDATVIGNNILSKDAKEAFNDTSLTNDDIDMVFVDIDNDPSTFNSSNASLKLPENQNKIVYAALYWTATYSYEQGYRQESGGQFLFQGKRIKKRDDINNVKLKLPNDSYKDIKGTIIFDGDKDSAFTLNSPYVCVADVTKLLRNLDDVNGEYTVANVNATKGFISGGSAAGWLLYVVYEAPTKNPKYITTFDGFAHVSNVPVKLKFNNFKSLEKGDVQTVLTFAALEGDSALTEDECILINPITKRASSLSTIDRPRNNFFNSKITNNSTVFSNRFPKSENTLGFDIVSLDVTSEPQPLIDNNTTEIEVVFNTESDRFYMFFTAFQTEISKSSYEENKNTVVEVPQDDNTNEIAEAKPKKEKPAKKEKEKKVKAKKSKREKPQKEENKKERLATTEAPLITEKPIQPKEKFFTPKTEIPETTTYQPQIETKEKPLPIWLKKKQQEEVVVVEENNVYQPDVALKNPDFFNNSLVMNRENYEKLLTKEDYVYETQKFKRMLNQETTYINGVEKGYYVIAGLLYDLDHALEYQNELKDQGVNSKIFKDISQEKYYVYLFNSENFYDVFMLRKAFIKSEFLEQVWILNINIEKQVIKKL
ncbi:hypothetical protein [Lacinutrix chionoecetis]